MSIVRYDSDSDVYVYQETGTLDYVCDGCARLHSLEALRDHLYGHVIKGDKVPKRAFSRLEECDDA